MKRRVLLTGALVASLALSSVTGALADDRDDLSGALTQNEQRQEQLAAELEGVDVNLQNTYIDLSNTQAAIPGAEAELAAAEAQVADAQRAVQLAEDRLNVAESDLAGIEAEIASAQSAIEESNASLSELARATYQNGGMAEQDPMALFFESDSTDEFFTQYTALDSAVRSQTTILDEVTEQEAIQVNAQARQASVLAQIEELKAAADQALLDAQAAEAAAEQRRAELVALQDQQTNLAASLESQRDVIHASQAQLDAEAANLAAEIAAIDAENQRRAQEAAAAAAAAAAADNSNSGGGAPAPAPAPSPSGSSYFIAPISGGLRVTSPYGWRTHPIFNTQRLHAGVDLSSACGSSQVAVAAGTVVSTRYDRGGGNIVTINHGWINGASYVSVYMHLSRISVSPGQYVAQGQQIGLTGSTGNSTGCHAHLEIWKNGSTINPMNVIN